MYTANPALYSIYMNNSKRMGFCDVPGHDDESDEVRNVPVEVEPVTFTSTYPGAAPAGSAVACEKHAAELRSAGLIL